MSATVIIKTTNSAGKTTWVHVDQIKYITRNTDGTLELVFGYQVHRTIGAEHAVSFLMEYERNVNRAVPRCEWAGP